MNTKDYNQFISEWNRHSDFYVCCRPSSEQTPSAEDNELKALEKAIKWTLS